VALKQAYPECEVLSVKVESAFDEMWWGDLGLDIPERYQIDLSQEGWSDIDDGRLATDPLLQLSQFFLFLFGVLLKAGQIINNDALIPHGH
jgi:hypothetical protein